MCIFTKMRKLGEGIGKLCRKCITKYFNKGIFHTNLYCRRCRKELEAEKQLFDQVFQTPDGIEDYLRSREI